MKGIVILLVIAGSQAAVLHPRLFPRIKIDCSNVGDDELVYFPHPTDCSKFYQCAFQKPVEFDCPQGLEWSVSENICEHPWLANCKPANKGANRCENVSDWQNVMFENEKDCGSYYQCVHHEPMLMKCPEGLHFSERLQRCEYTWIAGCMRN